MIAAYEDLFELGFCHSVEVWEGEEIVGGLYGVSIGRCFFGESMFHHRTNASKIALYTLSQTLFQHGFVMIDMQLPTPHLRSLGGRLVERGPFEVLLKEGLDLNKGGLKFSPGHDVSESGRKFEDNIEG